MEFLLRKKVYLKFPGMDFVIFGHGFKAYFIKKYSTNSLIKFNLIIYLKQGGFTMTSGFQVFIKNNKEM